MRSAFDSTITDEPPTRLDVDGLVARSRRGVRRRRAMAAMGAVVGLAAATAVPTVLLAGPGPAPGAAISAPGLSESQPTALAGQPTLQGRPATEPPADAIARLDLAVRDAVRSVAPGAQFVGPIPFEHRAADAVVNGDTYSGPIYMFWGYQVLAVDRMVGLVAVYTGRITDRNLCDEGSAYTNGDQSWTCGRSSGPAGETIITRVGRDGNAPTAGRQWIYVDVYRADGSYVTVNADNETERHEFGSNEVSPNSSQAPPLTVEQVTAIALDPRITIYP
jgi:hypothetical protein